MMREAAKYRQCVRFSSLVRDSIDDKQDEDYETDWKIDVETPLLVDIVRKMYQNYEDDIHLPSRR